MCRFALYLGSPILVRSLITDPTHSINHDFLLRSGISLETTQKLGGWKTPEVMLKHYRNPSLKELDEAATCIDSLVRLTGA